MGFAAAFANREADFFCYVVADFETAYADAGADRGDERPAAELLHAGTHDTPNDAPPTGVNRSRIAGLLVGNENGNTIGDPNSDCNVGRAIAEHGSARDDGVGLLVVGLRRVERSRTVHLPDLHDSRRTEGAEELGVRRVAHRERVEETSLPEQDRTQNAHSVVVALDGMRPQDPFIGREIRNGQFQILQKIGSGGMGAVYKALEPEMNRMVAVKVLHPKLSNRTDLTSRFRREARAMSQLTHPNTAKVFLYDELDDGSLYMIMEFLDGKNLNQTVRTDGPFPMQRALPILIQACGALDEAHKAGIIHRDLKPENIFLVQSAGVRDFAKVLDFGLAKVTERQMRPGSIILTQEGMVFGTPEFMSPEQAQGRPLTPASDIYSLAVILYEVLTGKLPFDATNAVDYIQLHVTGKVVPLNQRVAGRTFPPLLEQVIDRALSKRPEERFASAADFATAMQYVLNGADKLPSHLAGSNRSEIPTVQFAPIAAAAVRQQVQEVLAAGQLRASGGPATVAVLRSGQPALASRKTGRTPKTSFGLLLGVALAFLLLGVGLAVVLMKLVAK
jgi:serine/threonine protein kinase